MLQDTTLEANIKIQLCKFSNKRAAKDI